MYFVTVNPYLSIQMHALITTPSTKQASYIIYKPPPFHRNEWYSFQQTSLSRLIASVKPTLFTSQRQAHPTFMLSTPIAHICHGLYLSGELLISWARSRDSLNVLWKYSPVSCLMCLINMGVDPPGRLWYFANQIDEDYLIHRDGPPTVCLNTHPAGRGVSGVKGNAD